MNPKGVNDLDPKLRETYERIMGKTPQVISSNNESDAPLYPESARPILETHPENQAQSPAQSFINPSPVTKEAQIVKPNDPFINNPPPPAEIIAKNAVVNPKKKKSRLVPIILAFLVVVFFVAYVVFWFRIFGLI